MDCPRTAVGAEESKGNGGAGGEAEVPAVTGDAVPGDVLETTIGEDDSLTLALRFRPRNASIASNKIAPRRTTAPSGLMMIFNENPYSEGTH